MEIPIRDEEKEEQIKDPPKNCEYKIIQSYEDETSACLIYEFSKADLNTPMTHIFEVNDGKISKILLIFDTSAFI